MTSPFGVGRLANTFHSTQYHAALILLHRPYINHTQSTSDMDTHSHNHFTALSRSVCTTNARAIAKIFEQYRTLYDLSQVFVTGLQHAGTAATALMAEIMVEQDMSVREDLVRVLASLEVTISLMRETYQPAVLMGRVLDRFIRGCSARSDSGSAIGEKRKSDDNEVPGAATLNRRVKTNIFEFTANNTASSSPQGLPFLPSSWLEDLSTDDATFLNLVGLNQVNHSAAMGLLSASSYPWTTGT